MLNNLRDGDKIIKCKDCGEEFVFTETEQKFYAKQEYQNPKRCWKCRQARKNGENISEV